jgi:hypothetical protein
MTGDAKRNSGREREQVEEPDLDYDTCLRHWIIGRTVVGFHFGTRRVTEKGIVVQGGRPKQLPL